MLDLSAYPGGELVSAGLRDLERGVMSVEAMAVMVASPRLRDLGFAVPPARGVIVYEHALYRRLWATNPSGAHAAYNALIGLLVSFANAFRPDQGQLFSPK